MREDHVLQPIVAVRKAGQAVVRHVLGKPGHELVHDLKVFGLTRLVLLRPTSHLAFAITADPAEFAQAHRGVIDLVQGGQYVRHVVVDLATLLCAQFRQVNASEDTAVLELHDVEHLADDVFVLAERVGL